MDTHLESFKQFMKQREAAAKAYVCGDPAPVDRLTTRVSPATFFGPRGGAHQGAQHVLDKFNQDAALFGADSDTHFEILDMGASESIAYWVGFQPSTVQMQGNKEIYPMNLRVTEIFRREDNEWKLIHRHADMLADTSEHA
ncbi:MAG TPA: nuclear transport factor 2 family protein [Gammaproteobacteria bacterium]|nr:nuclear transport factor 2 family protein [Gammaproteobacteria bacterium]